MTLAAFFVGLAAGAGTVAVAAHRRIRHADHLAQHYLDLFVAAEASANRAIAERRRAEEIPTAVIQTYQRQVRFLQAARRTDQQLIRVLECAALRPAKEQ